MAEKSSVAEVRKILGKRRTKSGVEYLVKWKGRGQVKEYWVPFRFLHQSVEMVKAYNQSQKEHTAEVPPALNNNNAVKKTNVKPNRRTKKQKDLASHELTSENAVTPDRVNDLEMIASSISVNGTIKDSNTGLMQNGTMVKQRRKNTRKTVKDTEISADTGKREWTGATKGKTAVKSGIRLALNSPAVKVNPRNTANSIPSRKLVRRNLQNQSKANQDKNNKLPPAGNQNKARTQEVKVTEAFTQCKGASGKSQARSRGNKGQKLCVKLPGIKGAGSRLLAETAKNGVADSGSSDSEMLYSLADVDTSDTDQQPTKKIKLDETAPKGGRKGSWSKKRRVLHVKLKDLKHELSETNTTTPDSDPEVSFKNSPRKLLLKDSIRPKDASKPESPIKKLQLSKLPQSPRSSSATPSACQTPPRPTNDGSQRDPSPSLGSTNEHPPVIPILPNSPPAPNYDILVKHMTSHYNQGRGVKRPLKIDDKEPVERRSSVRQSESAFKYKEIVVKKNQNYTQIWLFSQTKRKNALNPKVFQELNQAFHNAKFDDSRVVLFTGSGRVFCSGVDLHYLTSTATDRRTAAKAMADSIKEFVNTLVAFPKPVVAAVNGPAVGLGVAILPLCDIIYASDKASFYCPYTKLGQTPEGCASYTFQQTMGLAMTNELLLPGRKITALEAYQIGLVSQVFWPTSMMQEVIPRLQQMATTSAKALEASKVLIRSHIRGKLQLTVETECQMLTEMWPSAECQRAIQAYIDEDEDMML